MSGGGRAEGYIYCRTRIFISTSSRRVYQLKTCFLTRGVRLQSYLIIRRTPFRAGPPDRVDTAKSSKKEEDDDNWELPQGGLPG